MSVSIRLRRTGKRNAPSNRIVVADNRCPRDGRFIETLGTYDPRNKMEKIDLERAEYWISQGAQPSETVGEIMRRAREGVSLYDRRLKREEEERKKAEEAARKKQEEAEKAAAEKAAADAEKAAAEKAAAEAEKEAGSDEPEEADGGDVDTGAEAGKETEEKPVE